MALTEREMTPQTAALDALVVELIDYKQWKLAQDESEGDRLAEMERRFRYTRCAFEAVRVARSRLYSKKLKQFRSGVTTQPEMTGAARPRNDISAASQQQKKIKESNGEITATAPPPEGSSPRPTTASPVGLHNSTPRQHRSAGRSTRRRRRLSSPQSENDDPQSQAYQEADEAGLSRRTVRTRSQTQKSLESRRVSARPAAKKARVEETVDFNDIYKRGAAKEKHAMIQFPKKSGNWYILRCSEHDASFGLNPLLGASRHLMGDGHAMAFRDDELSVQLLGVRVRDCDRAKADRNNSAMRRRRSRSLARTAGAPNNATASYSEGIISLDETTDSSSSEEEGIDLVRQESTAEEEGETEEEEESEEEEAEVEESAGEAENASNHAGTPSAISPDVPKPGVQGGVVDPRPGEIYRVFWKPSGIWCTALSVPVSGSFAKVGLTGSLLDTGAIDDSGRYPACYRSDGRVFRGWSVGYEDGGSMMWRRKFPFMWFGISDVDIDLDDELYNPKKAYFNWFPVHFIQPLNLADPRSESIKGYQWACQYSAWLEKRRLRHTAGCLEEEEEDENRSPQAFGRPEAPDYNDHESELGESRRKFSPAESAGPDISEIIIRSSTAPEDAGERPAADTSGIRRESPEHSAGPRCRPDLNGTRQDRSRLWCAGSQRDANAASSGLSTHGETGLAMSTDRNAGHGDAAAYMDASDGRRSSFKGPEDPRPRDSLFSPTFSGFTSINGNTSRPQERSQPSFDMSIGTIDPGLEWLAKGPDSAKYKAAVRSGSWALQHAAAEAMTHLQGPSVP